MDRPPLKDRAPDDRVGTDREAPSFDDPHEVRSDLLADGEAVRIAGDPPDDDVFRTAEPRRARGDGPQHRVEVERGRADHPKDLADRDLALERAREVVVVALHPQEGADAGEELGLVERLRQEVVGARVERLFLLLAAARGDSHDRQECRRGVRAQPAAELIAAHTGHDDVGEDEVGRLRKHLRERLLPRARADDLVARGNEDRLEKADVLGLVVDGEDAPGHARPFVR